MFLLSFQTFILLLMVSYGTAGRIIKEWSWNNGPSLVLRHAVCCPCMSFINWWTDWLLKYISTLISSRKTLLLLALRVKVRHLYCFFFSRILSLLLAWCFFQQPFKCTYLASPFVLPPSKLLHHPYPWLPIVPLPNLQKTTLRARLKISYVFNIWLHISGFAITSCCNLPSHCYVLQFLESTRVNNLVCAQDKHLLHYIRCAHCVGVVLSVWCSGSFQRTTSQQTFLLHSPRVSALKY